MISACRRDTRSAIPLSCPRSMSGSSPPIARPTIVHPTMVRPWITPKRGALPLQTRHAPGLTSASGALGAPPFWPAFLLLAGRGSEERLEGDTLEDDVLEDASGLPAGAAGDEAVFVSKGTSSPRTLFEIDSLFDAVPSGDACLIALPLPVKS